MNKQSLTAAVCMIIAASPALAEGTLSLTTGIDYSSGDYGSTVQTSILSIPFSVKYESETLTWKASVPWVRATAPAGSIIGPDGPIDSGAGLRATESGLGDLVTSLTWAAYENRKSGMAIDLTGKIKWGTASTGKGLGTGENDFSVEIDAYKSIGKVAWFANLGYRVYGDPSGIDLKNVAYGGLGVSGKLTQTVSIGTSWDYRPKITSTGDPSNELTVFSSHRINQKNKVQVYAVTGFSEGSPDWGGGLTLTHEY